MRDETLDFVIKFLKKVQGALNATVIIIKTYNGTEFVNQTLRSYYEDVRITHQTSVARTPQLNSVVERRNRTLVEVARTMLIFSKASLFLWTEAVAIACYTENRSLIRTRHNKTPYELMHDHKPDLRHFHVFGALCYPTKESEDLGMLKPKADIFVGYFPAKNAYLIYNKKTRMIIETIHVKFDELAAMASEQFSSGPAPQLMTLGYISSGLYFNPTPCVVSPMLPVAVPLPADTTGTPSLIIIDQDAHITSLAILLDLFRKEVNYKPMQYGATLTHMDIRYHLVENSPVEIYSVKHIVEDEEEYRWKVFMYPM
ncbi:retrovirus-related pol polyprotein from transposon TNT 1-94 [Tanacetum coccineum]